MRAAEHERVDRILRRMARGTPRRRGASLRDSIQPSSTSGTNSGQASAVTRTSGFSAWIARTYACERIVPAVPMTPMCPVRVARTAARAPGSTTPMTGTSSSSRRIGQRMRRRGVARDDDGLHALLEEERADLAAVAPHGVGRLGSVRHACRVAEIDQALGRQLSHDRMRDGEPAQPGVEHADRRGGSLDTSRAARRPARRRTASLTSAPGREHRAVATSTRRRSASADPRGAPRRSRRRRRTGDSRGGRRSSPRRGRDGRRRGCSLYADDLRDRRTVGLVPDHDERVGAQALRLPRSAADSRSITSAMDSVSTKSAPAVGRPSTDCEYRAARASRGTRAAARAAASAASRARRRVARRCDGRRACALSARCARSGRARRERQRHDHRKRSGLPRTERDAYAVGRRESSHAVGPMVAGVHGNRTHQTRHGQVTVVLKTTEATRPHPLPTITPDRCAGSRRLDHADLDGLRDGGKIVREHAGRHGQQQTARRLRIERERQIGGIGDRPVDQRCEVRSLRSAPPVRVPARQSARAPGSSGSTLAIDHERHATRACDVQGVAEQSEARDVGGAADAECERGAARRPRSSALIVACSASMASGQRSPFFAAVASSPVPSGFVRTRRSPGRAVGVGEQASRVRLARDAETELELLVDDRVSADRAPRPPRAPCPERRGECPRAPMAAACRPGKPTMASAVSGSPPMAKTSDIAFAAAIWPKVYGSSTMGAKKSTVWTSARSSRSTKTPASSKVSRPTRTRRSACVGTPLSASARSPGPSFAAQPAQRAKLVRRKSSARDLFVDMV